MSIIAIFIAYGTIKLTESESRPPHIITTRDESTLDHPAQVFSYKSVKNTVKQARVDC